MTSAPGSEVDPGSLHSLTLVLSSARSGSTLLCRDIASLGGLGAPREYFKVTKKRDDIRRRPPSSEADVLARVALGVRDEAPGVAGVKLMLPQASVTYSAISGRQLPPDKAMAGVVEWARERFDRVLLVFLFRNALDQAISRIVAHATGVFHSTERRPGPGDAAVLAIDDMNQRIMSELVAVVRNRDMLAEVLGEHEDIALALTYDEVAGDVDAYTRRLLAHAQAQGFEPQGEAVERVLTKVISPERSAALRQGFLDHLAGESGLPG